MPESKPFFVLQKLTSTEIRSLYGWFIVMRIVGTTIVGLGLLLLDTFHQLSFDVRPIVYWVLPLMLVSNLGWRLGLTKFKLPPFVLLVAQVVFDLLVITAGIYYSGGVASDFVYLYLIIILSSAMISWRVTVYIISLTLAFFLFTGYLVYLRSLDGLSLPEYLASSQGFIRLAIFALIAVIVGFQGYYYISRTREGNEALLKMKDDFLFRAVHDLRSPITVVRLLSEKYRDPGYACSRELKEDMATVEIMNQRVLQLIKDLSEAAKEESAVVTLRQEKVDVAKIIQDLPKEFAEPLVKKSVALKYEPASAPPAVLGDPQALKEIFSNLVDNAIKYNKEGGSVFIGHQVKNNFLRLSVKDTGAGISAASQAKLFSPYFRGDMAASTTGTGLGLYLVKKLTEKMGGSIELVSAPNQGSEFTISLPLAKS